MQPDRRPATKTDATTRVGPRRVIVSSCVNASRFTSDESWLPLQRHVLKRGHGTLLL